MEKLLPESLVELARQDPCVDIPEHRDSPLEQAQLPEGISFEEDGWCYGIQNAVGERRKHNWIMLFGKRDLFSGKVYFEIKLEGQEEQPCCGRLEELSRNSLILRLDGGEKKPLRSWMAMRVPTTTKRMSPHVSDTSVWMALSTCCRKTGNEDVWVTPTDRRFSPLTVIWGWMTESGRWSRWKQSRQISDVLLSEDAEPHSHRRCPAMPGGAPHLLSIITDTEEENFNFISYI